MNKRKAFLIVALVSLLGVAGCGERGAPSTEARGTPSPQTAGEATGSDGFYPPSQVEDGKVVMAVTFVDGSTGEIVAAAGLGIDDMTAQIYTAGGLDGVDRTITFSYGNGSAYMHSGPTETYEGYGGDPVEVWEGPPGYWECPNLVYRFDDWFVGVRTCQDELSRSEKESWARSLTGRISDEGFLVLSAEPPLELVKAGGHEGPELILGQDRWNWIELEPARCNPEDVPDEGDIRTMPDGTKVSFSRIEDGNSGIEYDWFATWCEDGLMEVQVSYAFQDFAESAAAGFRMRNIVLAD